MRLRREIEVWGTILYIDAASTHLSQAEMESALDKARDFSFRVDELFSTYKENSVVSQLRRGEIAIEETPIEVISVWDKCQQAKYLTDGAFDPWAVTGGFDPSGYVKGWAADKIADSLVKAGIEHVQVNAAGDLTLRGGFLEDGVVKPWSIGVSNPENTQEVLQVFEITDGAIATSGDYERGAHIHDPFTKMIAIGARSATVLGPDGGLADALATALVVAGKDGAVWFSQPELEGYKAWVINRHENTAWSINC